MTSIQHPTGLITCIDKTSSHWFQSMHGCCNLVPRLSPLRTGRAGRAWEWGYGCCILTCLHIINTCSLDSRPSWLDGLQSGPQTLLTGWSAVWTPDPPDWVVCSLDPRPFWLGGLQSGSQTLLTGWSAVLCALLLYSHAHTHRLSAIEARCWSVQMVHFSPMLTLQVWFFCFLVFGDHMKASRFSKCTSCRRRGREGKSMEGGDGGEKGGDGGDRGKEKPVHVGFANISYGIMQVELDVKQVIANW